MSRNRIKNSQSLHWMAVVKWVLIVGLFSGLGLSYMVCKNQGLHLADETLRLQERLDKIKARNAELSIDLERMKSPVRLQHYLAEVHSDLVPFGDARLFVQRMDEGSRAKIARMGGAPEPSLNLGAPVVAASSAVAEPR